MGAKISHGQPGRITDPSWQDVFVEWVGLDGTDWNSVLSYGYEALGEITEDEYERRAARVRAGLPPLG